MDYIIRSFVNVIVVFSAIALSWKIYICVSNKTDYTVTDKIKILLCILYFSVLISILIIPTWNFSPFYFPKPPERLKELRNLIPFKSIFEAIKNMLNQNDVFRNFINLFLNIAIFIPFPICIRSISKRISEKNLIIIPFAFSVFVEFIQYFMGRISDVDDVILNLTGVLIGYIVFKHYTHKSKIEKIWFINKKRAISK